MKRLLYMTQYYASSDQAGASRHYQHLRALIRQGYQATLITSYVKHRLRVIPPEYRHTKISLEEEEGLRIYKTYSYPNYGADFRSRMLNYLSFMFYATVAGIKAPPCDIVFASSPSLFVGVAGYILSRLRRVPFVFEVRDLWPETAVVMGALRQPLLIKMATWLALFLYGRAERVVAVTEGIREAILAAGIPEAKVVLVPNGVDDDLYADLPVAKAEQVRREYGWDGRFVAIYAGTLARSDGLSALVGAAASLTEYKDICFVFLGDGEAKTGLTDLVREHRLANVVFIPSQPKRRVPEFLVAADACLMPVKNDAFFQMHLPNKLFDYMAAGRPVIAAVPPGETQRLVEQAQAGLVIAAEDEVGLAAALLDLRDDPAARRRYGENGRRYVLEHYSRSTLANRLISTLDAVLQQKGTLGTHEARSQRLQTH